MCRHNVCANTCRLERQPRASGWLGRGQWVEARQAPAAVGRVRKHRDRDRCSQGVLLKSFHCDTFTLLHSHSLSAWVLSCLQSYPLWPRPTFPHTLCSNQNLWNNYNQERICTWEHQIAWSACSLWSSVHIRRIYFYIFIIDVTGQDFGCAAWIWAEVS